MPKRPAGGPPSIVRRAARPPEDPPERPPVESQNISKSEHRRIMDDFKRQALALLKEHSGACDQRIAAAALEVRQVKEQAEQSLKSALLGAHQTSVERRRDNARHRQEMRALRAELRAAQAANQP